MQDAIDIKVLQTLSPERKRQGYRSAGACPPRVFDPNEKRRLERSAGPLGCHTRIRAGFPRAISAETANVHSPETTDVCCHDRRMARDRPSPYGNRDGCLLPYHHLPRSSEITGFERIEIDTACNRFSLCIAAIPIRRPVFVRIHARRDLTEFQGADEFSV